MAEIDMIADQPVLIQNWGALIQSSISTKLSLSSCYHHALEFACNLLCLD